MKKRLILSQLIIFSLLLVSCGAKPTKDATEARNQLEKSLTLSIEAHQLSPSSSSDSTVEVTTETKKAIKNKIEESIKIGKNIDEEYLNWIHKDFKFQFNEHLLKGMETYLNGLESNNTKMQESGNQLTEKWNVFWEENNNLILDKMFPDRHLMKIEKSE